MAYAASRSGLISKICWSFILLASFSAFAFEKEIPSIFNRLGFTIHKGDNVLDKETYSVGVVDVIWDTGIVRRYESNGPPNVHHADYLVPEITGGCLDGICKGVWVINKRDHTRSKVTTIFADGTARVLVDGLYVTFYSLIPLTPEEKQCPVHLFQEDPLLFTTPAWIQHMDDVIRIDTGSGFMTNPWAPGR